MVFIVFLLFFALRLLIVFSPASDLGGIEQNVIYSIQVLMDSGNLYLTPAKAPFSITQYTPIYYHLCSFTAKALGLSKDYDIQQLYIIGRSWDIIFSFISALLLFVIGRYSLLLSKNKSYFLSLLSFSIFFLQNNAVRSDALCDMLSIASLYTFILYQDPSKKTFHSNFLLTVTILLTALAVFSKQSGIQLIIIYSGFSLLIKDWKTLAKTFFIVIIIYGGFLWLFTHLYNSFFENVIGGVSNGIGLKNFFKYVIGKLIFVITIWPLIIISCYFLIKNNSIFKGNNIIRLLAVATLGTLIFATVTALKMGSTTQYYILFVNLSLLFIMAALEQNSLINASNSIYIKPVFFSFLGLVILTYGIYNLKTVNKLNNDPYLINQRATAVKVATYLKDSIRSNSPKYVFANLTTDSFLPGRQRINNILFKNCLMPQIDILEYSTRPSKILGYNNLENMINDGKVEYIIESQPRIPFILLKNLEAIEKSKFRLVKQFDGYLIYKFYKN